MKYKILLVSLCTYLVLILIYVFPIFHVRRMNFFATIGLVIISEVILLLLLHVRNNTARKKYYKFLVVASINYAIVFLLYSLTLPLLWWLSGPFPFFTAFNSTWFSVVSLVFIIGSIIPILSSIIMFLINRKHHSETSALPDESQQ